MKKTRTVEVSVSARELYYQTVIVRYACGCEYEQDQAQVILPICGRHGKKLVQKTTVKNILYLDAVEDQA